MSDFENIIYTACATILGGVILLAITELVKVIIISPVQKTKEQIQVVLSRVDFYCNSLTNFFSAEPDEEEKVLIGSIKKDLRMAATDLRSKYTMVPFKKFLSWMRFLPSQDRVDIAFSSLIYLHNSILYEGRREYIINLIEMNDNRIEVIHAALTGGNVPVVLAAEQRAR